MEGFMKDSQGRLVPVDMIKPVDKARDDLVQSIVSESQTLAGMLKEFRDGQWRISGRLSTVRRAISRGVRRREGERIAHLVRRRIPGTHRRR